jgi:hypothetical protein
MPKAPEQEKDNEKDIEPRDDFCCLFSAERLRTVAAPGFALFGMASAFAVLQIEPKNLDHFTNTETFVQYLSCIAFHHKKDR